MHWEDRVADTPAQQKRHRQHASRQGEDIRKEEGAKETFL